MAQIRRPRIAIKSLASVSPQRPPTTLMTLPRELIYIILLHLTQISGFCWDHPLGRCLPSCEPYDWTEIMNVNKAMRDIVLSYPLLWTNISSYDIGACATILERSKHHLLDYRDNVDDHDAETTRALYALVLKEHHRLRGLDLYIDLDKHLNVEELQKRLEISMPFLTHLNLYAVYSEEVRSDRFILTSDAPKLEFIQTGGLILLPSPALATVKSCCLLCDEVDWPRDDLADLLHSMPQLRSLWIDKPDYEYEASEDPDILLDVNLPSLKNLEILTNTNSFELFAFHLNFKTPNLRHLRVINRPDREYEPGAVEPPEALSLLAQLMPKPNIPLVHDMAISVDGWTTTGVSVLTRPLNPSQRVEVELRLFEYFDDEMEFATVYQELITHPLKSLIILSDPEASRTTSQADKITHPFWVYFLGSSYTLTYIEIQVPDQLTFFCACCRSSYPLLYPSLQ
ncbi:hypothetical protein ONZ45_g3243 [Pleurotus djamor]|nr:hypothetical protein ONZ45_g3243 [Pleurotus djamor]